MTRIVAFENVTLDGVMQAPGRPDEDSRGGFRHGGWATPYADEVAGRAAAEGMAQTEAILLGRRTYEDFASVWPKQGDSPFGRFLNDVRKYVASRTLDEPLEWENSTLLDGDATDAVARLRDAPGKDIVILGSGELVRSLLPAGLIDQFVLQIHPLVLGTGIRLFADDGEGRDPLARFDLVDATTTTTGVVVATYRRA